MTNPCNDCLIFRVCSEECDAWHDYLEGKMNITNIGVPRTCLLVDKKIEIGGPKLYEIDDIRNAFRMMSGKGGKTQ